MISTKTANSSYTLMNLLLDNTVTLTPKVASVIGPIVHTTASTLEIESDGLLSTVDSINRTDLTGTVPHTVELNKISKLVVDSIRATLRLARTVVVPMHIDVIKSIDAYVDTQGDIAGTTPINSVFLESIFTNSSFQGFIEKYEDSPAVRLDLDIAGMPVLSASELVELFVVGVPAIDTDLSSLLDKIGGGDVLVQIYNKTFRDDDQSEFELLDIDPLDVLAVKFVLGFAFENELPDEAVGNHGSLSAHASWVKINAGRALCLRMAKNDKAIKDNTLIISYPRFTGDDVKVHGEVMNKFISQGGSPEVVLGSLLSGDESRSFDHLLQNAAKYCKVTRDHENRRKRKVRYDLTRNIELATRKALTTIINGDEFLDMAGLLEDNKPVYHDRLRTIINEKPLRGDVNYQVWVRYVLIKLFWDHTDVKVVLADIDEQMAESPSLDAREAAAGAAIELVCVWLLDHVDFKQVPKLSSEQVTLIEGTLYTMVELAVSVITAILGNEVSNTRNGELIYATIHDVVVARFAKRASHYFEL